MTREKRAIGLSTKIFIALLLGAVAGITINYLMPAGYFKETILINGILHVIGNGFIRLMQMLVIPLVICSLICGAMAIGDMLPIIVFSVFVGILLARMGTKAKAVSDFFVQSNDLMMEMTMAVMNLAPVGVFCMIAKTFSTIGFDAFLPMIKYMLSVIGALAIQCFIVYQVLLFLFTRLNPMTFLRKFFPVMQFAFSTSTSNATIPMSIETLTNKIGVSRKISSFTIPLGATINMDGTAIMQGVAVVFVAEAYGYALTPTMLLTVIATATLASIGTAGVPSVGLVTLAMVLTSVGLPTEGIALIMGIDRILDMLRTAVNITGDAVCTTMVAKQEGAFDIETFHKN